MINLALPERESTCLYILDAAFEPEEDHTRKKLSRSLDPEMYDKEESVSFSQGSTIYLHFHPAPQVHTIVTQIAWSRKR